MVPILFNSAKSHDYNLFIKIKYFFKGDNFNEDPEFLNVCRTLFNSFDHLKIQFINIQILKNNDIMSIHDQYCKSVSSMRINSIIKNGPNE